MQTLTYSTRIPAPPERVWHVLTDQEEYRRWTKSFSPDSQLRGKWTQGSHMVFFDPNMGGTKALLETVEPGRKIHAVHMAMVDKDGVEGPGDEMGRKWIGSTETYELKPVEDGTELVVTYRTDAAFKPMFDAGWPAAFELIKQRCEAAG